MTRHILRLVILSTLATLSLSLASTAEAANDGKIKLAMGPISAAQKNQGPRPAPDAAETTGTTPWPHYHPRHRHHRSARGHKH